MAFRYLIYRTDFDNTIVKESPISGTTTGVTEQELYSDFLIPIVQPLYFWRVEVGLGVFQNSETNIDQWLAYITPPPSPNSLVTYSVMQDYAQSITGFTAHTSTTGLQQITDINASTTNESTFSNGLITNKIKPSSDSVTAIQVHKADGVTNVINVDTVSGLTGFGTIAPKGLIHAFGANTFSEVNDTQTNAIIIDGISEVDKEIQWRENGQAKWSAGPYRDEKTVFWYLYNTEAENSPITVMETGRIGINKQTNYMNYHATQVVGNGLNDIVIGGIYTENFNLVYEIKIATTSGITDTYIWRKSFDDGATYGDYSPMSGCSITPVEIEHGVLVSFEHTIGHTIGNEWRFAAFSQIPQATLTVAPMGISEVQRTNNYNATPIEYTDITSLANGGVDEDGFTVFDSGATGTIQAIYWGTTVKINSIFFNLKTFGAGIQLYTQYWTGIQWVTIDDIANNYLDGTVNLTKSGRIIWSPKNMNWNMGYIPYLSGDSYSLYWLRIITTTNPSTAPVAKSLSIGNDKRFSVYNSFNDYKPSTYIDSLGRMNIGGGVITGSNRFQVNSADNLQVAAVSGGDSYVEFDSEDSSLSTLRLKVSSNDTLGTSLEFGRTRGTLNVPLSMETNDLIGRINFKGRVGTSGSVSSQISSQYVGDGSTTRCADLIFGTACGSCTAVATEKVRIRYDGTTGFGVSGATATVHIKAGTTSVAPLKFNAGSLLSSPQAGAMEYDGNATYITTTGLTRETFAYLNSPIFTGNPQMPSGTTFNGLATCSIRPLVDGTQAIHIHKADGITPLVDFDTISGFTGFGTVAPKAIIHTYGVNNFSCDNGWNLQTNSVRVDGGYDSDKDFQWFSEGKPKFTAQIYRCENGKFWYLSSPEGHVNQLTVSDTGRVGINNQTNIMAHHAALLTGGPNDMRVSGYYTQSYTVAIIVEIDSVTGVTDTFRWKRSNNGGDTYGGWSSSSGLTLTPIDIFSGVNIQFENLTGHTLGTSLIFGAFAQLPLGNFMVTPNRFTEVQLTNNYNANPILYQDVTAEANSSTYGTNITLFNIGVINNAAYFGTLDELNALYANIDTAGVGVTLIVEYWSTITNNWVDLTINNNAFNDDTNDLTQSGNISWETSSMTGWNPAYMSGLTETGYFLYWIRLRTTTAPTTAPVINSFARGGRYRMGVLTSPSDFKTSFYVDTIGRTNVGGGNITGNNVLQVNKNINIPVPIGDVNSLVELDSEDSSAIDLKLKLASNDACGAGVIIGKTRGTLNVGLNAQYADEVGHIKFLTRVNNVGINLNKITSQYYGDGSTSYGDLVFSTSNGSTPIEKLRISGKGTGFGITVPTAQIHIASGTTSIAPLKFNSGSLLSSPQAGAVEFLTDAYYGTITNGSERKTFAFLESPTFSGNVDLPNTTCLDNTNLCNYILQSGGSSNNTLTKTCDFNAYTGVTVETISKAITGATNGICKTNCHDICLGGVLTTPLVISGNSTYDITLSSKVLYLCGTNGVNMTNIGGTGIDIYTKGSHVDIRGNDISNVEKTKLLISDTNVTFTDNRTTKVGIEYNGNYSDSYSARSLVDKAYVDSVASGLAVKASANVATTGNMLLSGLTTIDGVAVANGNRILVKNQNTGSQNGIYVATGTTWQRADDYNFNPSGEISNGDLIPVVTGNTNGNTIWVLTTPDPIVSGDTLSFSLFSKTSAVIGGDGINVTQVGGNYDVSVKLTSNCGLCVDSSGLRVNNNIAGTGLDYSTGVLSVCGSALAGNSLSWVGNQFAVNPTGGTLSTALNLKLDKSIYQTYTGTTAPNRFLDKTIYQTYTGTTAPNRYLDKSIYQTYTGTTVPQTYLKISTYCAYTGATSGMLNLKANISGETFTGIPKAPTAAVSTCNNQIATTCFVLQQAGTAIPLMDNVTCAVGSSLLYSRQDHIHPSDTSRLITTIYQTYTGTTAPARFLDKSIYQTYTGTTAPNRYLDKSIYQTYTGTTIPNTYATISLVNQKAYLSGATFTGVVNVPKPTQNDNTTCAATTSWYISQGGTTNALMDGTAGCGISNLFARQDHVHPSDTSRVVLSVYQTYTGTTAPNTFAPKASPTFTGTVTIPTPFTLGAISVKTTGTELNYVTGATSNIQTQLNAKSLLDTAIVSATGATLVNSTYAGKTIEANGTFTITFPNSMATGMQVDVVNVGTGTITIAASTTLQSKSGRNKLASQYIGASVYHRGSNVWLAVGDLTP